MITLLAVVVTIILPFTLEFLLLRRFRCAGTGSAPTLVIRWVAGVCIAFAIAAAGCSLYALYTGFRLLITHIGM